MKHTAGHHKRLGTHACWELRLMTYGRIFSEIPLDFSCGDAVSCYGFYWDVPEIIIIENVIFSKNSILWIAVICN